MKFVLTIAALLALSVARAQALPDHIYAGTIHSVKLYKTGNIYSYPVMTLNSTDELELHFDDLAGDVKTYYYSFELRNADWSPTLLKTFDYIKGFQNTRISNYRTSNIAQTRYTHYQAVIPDRNCKPSRSGNYLLRVFLNGDTNQTVFTKRMLVVDNKATAGAQVQQPFNAQWFNTHQRVNVSVSTNGSLGGFNGQDMKVVVLQNYIWPQALYLTRPNIFRGNYFEYNDESLTTFQGGREWRWIDLRSLRLLSDRMQSLDNKNKITEVYVKPDGDRNQKAYIYYRDLNGLYTMENSDNVNPFWQSDYANVHFSFFPAGNRPYEGKSLYIFGELTNYTPSESSKMTFNEEKGAYEITLSLKQGFYNYAYIAVPDKPTAPGYMFENMEGNYWGTENAYTVLVYYRPFGGRADELIGYNTINSVFNRPGF